MPAVCCWTLHRNSSWRLPGISSARPCRSRIVAFSGAPVPSKSIGRSPAPIPWSNPLCGRAGTVHLGASLEEIATSEREVWQNRVNTKPYILLSQPSVFDPSRAPEGKQVGWAYCHVPNGSRVDATDAIEAQVERFAPGFRATILARSTRDCAGMERWNANLLGGDVSGGAMTLKQMIRRPTLPPYVTPLDRVFLCSSSTPPGGGVHGMCGALAAAVAARRMGLAMPDPI